MPRKLSAEILAKQLARSGLSVGANMQEADGAESKDDFIHKVSVAYKEARESRHWLKTIRETVMKGDAEVVGSGKKQMNLCGSFLQSFAIHATQMIAPRTRSALNFRYCPIELFIVHSFIVH